MDIRIPDPVVSTGSVRASKAFGLDLSGCSPPTVDLSPRSHRRQGSLRRGEGRRVAARRTIEGSPGLEETGQQSASSAFGMSRAEMEPVPLREPEHCQQKQGDEERQQDLGNIGILSACNRLRLESCMQAYGESRGIVKGLAVQNELSTTHWGSTRRSGN
jgi:hypothetical protein